MAELKDLNKQKKEAYKKRKETTFLYKYNGFLENSKIIKNKDINNYLKNDFTKFVYQKDNHYYNLAGKRLLSFSSLTKKYNDFVFEKIPFQVLENRKELGRLLMQSLKIVWDTKDTNINNLLVPEQTKRHLSTIINFLDANNLMILDCEKLITNNSIIGFVDLIVKQKNTGTPHIVEIKLRNSLEIKKSDLVQSLLYSKLLGCPCFVLVVNDIGEFKTFNIYKDIKLKNECEKVLNSLIDNLNYFTGEAYNLERMKFY